MTDDKTTGRTLAFATFDAEVARSRKGVWTLRERGKTVARWSESDLPKLGQWIDDALWMMRALQSAAQLEAIAHAGRVKGGKATAEARIAASRALAEKLATDGKTMKMTNPRLSNAAILRLIRLRADAVTPARHREKKAR